MKSLVIFFALAGVLFSNSYSQSKNIVQGKGVYFFGPSQAEMDSADEKNAEALDDFTYYTNRAGPYLNEHHLKADYISNRIIEIKFSNTMMRVYRDSVDFGTILTDGINRPKVLEYVLTDDELKQEIRTYFKLKR